MLTDDEENLQATLNEISLEPKVHLKLLSIFLSQFETDCKQLEKSVSDQDHINVSQSAHKLKSALKIFDYEMFVLVSQLEKYGSDLKDFDLIKSVYTNFDQKVHTKIPVLQKVKTKIESHLGSEH